MNEVGIRPLEGLTVAQLGVSPAVSYCALLLRQFGARALVVAPDHDTDPADPDGGSVSSGCGRYLAASDAFLNDGKERSRLSATAVAAVADVVVRDRQGDPLGMDPPSEHEFLLQHNPDLVYAVLSPFGAGGPWADQPGVDLTAQALGGMSAVIGYPDRQPLTVPYEIAGLSQGLHAAAAILARLLAPAGTRPTGPIDVATSDVIASYTRMYTLLYRFYGWPVIRAGHRAPGSGGRYPMTILPCRDGFVVLIGRSRRDWERYLDMIGRPAWTQEPKYKDPLAIAVDYADEIDAYLRDWLADYTREELTALAHQYGVALAPVRTISEVLADRQMAHRGFFQPGRDSPHVRLPGFPARFVRAGPTPNPHHSTHTGPGRDQSWISE